MEGMGLLSAKTELGFSASSGGTYEKLLGLQEIPDLGGTPEKVETTTLDDLTKTYINGLVDFGDLEFVFLYKNAGATDSFRILEGLQKSNALTYFQVKLPDGTAFAFGGYVTVKVNGFGTNAPVQFTLAIALNTAITVTHPTEAPAGTLEQNMIDYAMGE